MTFKLKGDNNFMSSGLQFSMTVEELGNAGRVKI